MTTQYLVQRPTKRPIGALREVVYSVGGFTALILLLSWAKLYFHW